MASCNGYNWPRRTIRVWSGRRFSGLGIAVVGPKKQLAQIETSKGFAEI